MQRNRYILISQGGDGIEKCIVENIDKLFHSQIINAILYFVLIIVAILGVVGVTKLKLLKSKAKIIALSLTIAICSIGLIIIQVITILPVYNDYIQQSYVIVENATMTVAEGSAGGIDPTNTVFLSVDGNEFALKMQTDYSLDTNKEYAGTVAYLKHSKYIIWYSFE